MADQLTLNKQRYGSDFIDLNFGAEDPNLYYQKNADGQFISKATGQVVTNAENINTLTRAGVGGNWTPTQLDYRSGTIPQEDLAQGAHYVAPPVDPNQPKEPPASGIRAGEHQSTLQPKTKLVNGQRVDIATGQPYVDGDQQAQQQALATTQPISSYSGPSIVDYLNSIGQPSSFSARSQLAQQTGIQNYTGTAEQNTRLLDSLRHSNQPAPQVTSGAPTEIPSASINPAPLAKYGIPQPNPQETPIVSFASVYKDLLKSLGVNSIKKQFDNTQKEFDKLQNELNDKISDINENPWLSEGVRIGQINKLQERYEGKLGILTNKMKIYDSQYQEGIDEAKFVANQAFEQYQFDTQLQLKLQDLAQQRAAAEAKLTEFDPSTYKEVQGGLYDIKNNQWVVSPKVAGTGSGNTPTSYDEWTLAGGLAGTGKTYAQFIENVKPATVAQGTIAGFASRLEQSNPIISNLTSYISGLNPAIFEAQRLLPSYLQTDQYKQFDQAARNFINAVLRRESGAVISPSEFDNAYRQYLPRAGDDEITLAQKEQNRELQYQTFKNGAGSAYQSVNDLLGTTNNNDPFGIFTDVGK